MLVAVCGCVCALGRCEMSSVGHGGLIREGFWRRQGFRTDVLLLFVLVRRWISMCDPRLVHMSQRALWFMACEPVCV